MCFSGLICVHTTSLIQPRPPFVCCCFAAKNGTGRERIRSGMVRNVIAVFFVFGSSLEKSASQYTDCAEDLRRLSDGFCDSATNNLACNYFGGDCCSCTCVETPLYSCGSNGFNCLDPACPDEDPSPYPNCTGNFNWLNDGWCDPIETNNNPACGYDGGDCCACTCVDGPLYSCGSNGLNCDNTACLDLAIAVLYLSLIHI